MSSLEWATRRSIVRDAALGKRAGRGHLNPNCSAAVIESMPRRVRDQFRNDHAQLPALLGSKPKRTLDQHEIDISIDISVIQSGALDRLAERANVAGCINRGAVCRHLKRPMYFGVVVQEIGDASQSQFGILTRRSRRNR